MNFKIELSEEAMSALKKLDNPTVKRILDRIVSAASDPNHFFERFTGREDYKLRVGDYRIIAKIDRKERIVFVLSLGHRRNVYKH